MIMAHCVGALEIPCPAEDVEVAKLFRDDGK